MKRRLATLLLCFASVVILGITAKNEFCFTMDEWLMLGGDPNSNMSVIDPVEAERRLNDAFEHGGVEGWKARGSIPGDTGGGIIATPPGTTTAAPPANNTATPPATGNSSAGASTNTGSKAETKKEKITVFYLDMNGNIIKKVPVTKGTDIADYQFPAADEIPEFEGYEFKGWNYEKGTKLYVHWQV